MMQACECTDWKVFQHRGIGLEHKLGLPYNFFFFFLIQWNRVSYTFYPLSKKISHSIYQIIFCSMINLFRIHIYSVAISILFLVILVYCLSLLTTEKNEICGNLESLDWRLAWSGTLAVFFWPRSFPGQFNLFQIERVVIWVHIKVHVGCNR